MLRFVTNVVLVLCLTTWCAVVLATCMAVGGRGLGGISRELIHVAGQTNQLGGGSGRLVIWRLSGLLVVTLLAIYARRATRS